MKKKTFSPWTAAGVLLITLFAVLCLLPLVYMVAVSFTDSESLYIKASDLRPSLYNYWYAIVKRDFGTALKNSIITVVGSCLLVDVVASMAAYGFEKKPVPGKETLFQGYLATMMIPGQVMLIPMFVMINRAGLTNTYAALILPMVGAFGIFLMRQFMVAVPNELLEAAEMDGCGWGGKYVRIMLPLSVPSLITSAIFGFYWSWQEFLQPLIYISKPRLYPVSIALKMFSDPNTQTNWSGLFAMTTLSILPVLLVFMFLQRYYVEGVTAGAVKG